MKVYIVGFSFELDRLVEYQSREQADYEAEDWVAIEANSLEEAMDNYETEFERWKNTTSS